LPLGGLSRDSQSFKELVKVEQEEPLQPKSFENTFWISQLIFPSLTVGKNTLLLLSKLYIWEGGME
jgi:hypothetical protein